ncbi:18592_t:CDS:1 [Funneliformis geosporum]|uniref:13221_t:CDS:1 n=1 Tax=Funneliformis geosporum TaxID=1117311 RepID=A0A9W4T002_9GLOM|nr:13221_t:CDS:1 [Funneliformis geosporum]CAI2187437.1 18592_t:CDS:1 [Funneliformis geosporum]
MNFHQKNTISPSKLSLNSLREILGYFKNDPTTLYSLLFVNRQWCDIAIQLLWRQPFEFTTQKNYGLIIETYICCLPELEKSRLILTGIKVPKHSKPFYKYSSYLRNFDSDKFHQAFNLWLKTNVIKESGGIDPLNLFCKPLKSLFGPMVSNHYNLTPSNILHKAVNKCLEPIVQEYCSTHPNSNVVKEMQSLLFSEFNRLRNLTLSCGCEGSLPLMEMIDALCMKNLDALIHLQIFELNVQTTTQNQKIDLSTEHDILENLLLTIARNATNIQHMKINVPHEYQFPPRVHIALYTMVASQKKLSSYMSNYYWDSDFSIHSALIRQSRSLKRLNLWGFTHFDDSLFQGLTKWTNLETLELVGCPGSSPMSCGPTNHRLNIKNLRIGIGYGSCPYIQTTLLQMCNTNLQQLMIEGVTPEILEEIGLHCPNITHLSLCAYQDISKSLPKLISSLDHLKVLTLGHHEKFLFTKSTIRKFIQSIPSSLRFLSLNFNISYDSLKVLLDESQPQFYKLELHQTKTFHDQFINILIDYTITTKNLTQIKLFIPAFNLEQTKKMIQLSAPLEVASPGLLKSARKHINICYRHDNRNIYSLW